MTSDASNVEYRFEIALSFAGDGKRDTVREVAELLRAKLGDGKVFFDEWFDYEIAGPDAHNVLQDIYRKSSRLVVAFLCEKYGSKSWPQDEWRAIQSFERTLRGPSSPESSRDRFLPLRFGEGDVPGVLDTTVAPNVQERSPKDIAALILKRLRRAGWVEQSSSLMSEVATGSPVWNNEKETVAQNPPEPGRRLERAPENSPPRALTPADVSLPSFVGRTQEIEEFQRLLAKFRTKPEALVITISGNGGVGKTALARALCKSFLEQFEDAEIVSIELQEAMRQGTKFAAVSDLRDLMAKALASRIGAKFARYREARELPEAASETIESAERNAESAAFLSDFVDAVRRFGKPILLEIDDYELVDLHRGLRSAKARNFCHEWVVWFANKLVELPVILLIVGRELEASAFESHGERHLAIPVRGLKAPDVKKMLQIHSQEISTRIARQIAEQTDGHPLAIRYFLAHILHNQLNEQQIEDLLVKGDAPYARSALARILRYSWDEHYIAKERRSLARVERIAYTAIAMLSFRRAYPDQDVIVQEAIEAYCADIGVSSPEDVLGVLSSEFASLFAGDVLHPTLSDALTDALRAKEISGVDGRKLAQFLLQALRKKQDHPADAVAREVRLGNGHWQRFEAAQISLIAWISAVDAANEGARFVLSSIFLHGESRNEMLLDLLNQAGVRLIPWCRALEKCSRDLDSPAALSRLLKDVSESVSSEGLASNLRVAIEALTLRIRRREVPESVSTVDVRPQSFETGLQDPRDRVLGGEIARHFLFERAAYRDGELLPLATADYQAILDTPGRFCPEDWAARTAGKLFELYLGHGDFESASLLLPRLRNRITAAASLEERRKRWRSKQLGYAEDLIHQDSLAEARRILSDVKKQFPHDDEVLINLLRVLRRLGLATEAAELERSASLQLTDPRGLIRRGEIALMSGEIDRAKASFDAVFQSLGGRQSLSHKDRKVLASAINHRAEIALLTGNYADAVLQFSDRIRFGQTYAASRPEKEQRERDGRLIRHAYTKRGFAQLLSHDRIGAEQSFSAAIEIDPDYYHASLGLALVKESWQNFALASAESLKKAQLAKHQMLETNSAHIDPQMVMDGMHLNALVGVAHLASKEILAAAERITDLGKMHFLRGRLICSARRFPDNTGVSDILTVVSSVLERAETLAFRVPKV